MTISKTKLEKLLKLISLRKEHYFYTWQAWILVRDEVLKLDNYECQRCKKLKKRYKKAIIVHHIKHLKDRPDLALSIWDSETGERQLESVCKECHEELHPESQKQYKKKINPVTIERWD